MEVKLVSQCCVKPSSPTPDRLKTHKLSLLDQFIPPMYIPLALVYQETNQTKNRSAVISQRASQLKQSLSEALTCFYPLAGRIKDNLSVDCNDEGAYYVEARTNCPLSEFLNDQSPDLSLMHKFLPDESTYQEACVTLVQETTFTCGGIIICLRIYHMVVDGTALSCFLKAWAAAASKETETMCPNFDAPNVFPQSEAFPREATMMALFSPFFQTSRAITRRFVFDASAVAKLKAKATSSKVENPTRVEAVSAFLCKCIMAIRQARSDGNGIQRPTLVTHIMNLRSRAVPPFPGCSIGNFVWSSAAICTTDRPDLATLVLQLRESIQRIDGDFVKKLQGDRGMEKLHQEITDMAGSYVGPGFPNGLGHIGFTSWCNFGLYDIDFGWGKPAWVRPVTSSKPQSPFITTILLMDTRTGKGLEAIATLDEEDLANLVCDQEILAHSEVDPNPLKAGN